MRKSDGRLASSGRAARYDHFDVWRGPGAIRPRQSAFVSAAFALVEFPAGRRLVRAHASGLDLCEVIVLTTDRSAGHPSEQGELTDVRQRISHRPLEEPFE